MIAQNNTTISDAVCTIQELTADERVRLQCEARERYERDWNSEMSAMHKKGLQEGIQTGIQQERERNRLEQQKNLDLIKAKNSELETKAAQIEALSSELERLKAELATLKA